MKLGTGCGNCTAGPAILNAVVEEIAATPAGTAAEHAAKARAAHRVMSAAGPAPNDRSDQLVSEVLRAVAQSA